MNQVSKMSASPVNPPGWSRCASPYPGGGVAMGSTGKEPSSARMGAEKSAVPSPRSGYHTGNGTPKYRWRLIPQSRLRFSVQFR